MKPKLKWATVGGREYLVCSVCGHTPLFCGCAVSADVDPPKGGGKEE